MAERRFDACMLGVGMIGGGMVEAWLDRGRTVAVWNRSATKTEPLVAKGAVAFSSVREAAAGSRAIHIAVSDDAAVDAMLSQLMRAPSAIDEGAVVVDHTTTSTKGTAARAAAMAAAGVAFAHAPVFMSPAMCREAKGLMLLAGPTSVRERVRPLLQTMTGEVIDLGDRGDAAAAFKLFGNAMIVTLTAGIADVFSMARANGIAATDALSLFSKFNPAGIFAARGARMAKGEFSPASFALSMARKDVRLMIESSGDEVLSVLPGVAERMDELLARGLGDEDMGVLAVDALKPGA